MQSKADYFLAESPRDVPGRYFGKDFVVQEFRPERDGGDYVLREYLFLGDRHYQMIQKSDSALIDEDRFVSLAPFKPHSRLLDARRRLGLDYGKIDFVMHDGVPFIFDANKTLGLGAEGYDILEPFRLALEDMARAAIGVGQPADFALAAQA